MTRITLTVDLARAAGVDAANTQMRKAGRKAWNLDDYNLAADTTNRLMACLPVEEQRAAGWR